MTPPHISIELEGKHMRAQEYRIHLIGGRTIHVCEELSGPVDTFLHNRFLRCKPDDILVAGTPETHRAFIPARNILYISTGESIEE